MKHCKFTELKDDLLATKVPGNVVAKRYVSKEILKQFDTFEIGEVITDKGFISGLVSKKGAKKSEVKIEILEGQKGRLLSDGEFLFPPGTKFKVVSKEPPILQVIGVVDDEVISGSEVVAKKSAEKAARKVAGAELKPVKFNITADMVRNDEYGTLDTSIESKAVLEEIAEHFSYQGTLTNEVRRAYNDYAGEYYDYINRKLRGKEKEWWEDSQKVSKLMEEDLRKNVLQNDYLVKRKIGNSFFKEAAEMKIGEEIKDPAFMSTSLNPISPAQLKEARTILIEIPKGTNGRYIAKDSGIPGETEILLPPNTWLKLVSRDDGILRFRVVDSQPAPTKVKVPEKPKEIEKKVAKFEHFDFGLTPETALAQGDEIVDFIDDHFFYQDDLFNAEKDAFTRYAFEDYKEINSWLRGTGPLFTNGMQEKISMMQNTLLKSKTETNYLVKRNLFKKLEDIWSDAKVGDIVTDKGFGSTSLHRITEKELKSGTTVEIEVPKGSNARYIGELSDWKEDELELLLASNTKFKILSLDPPRLRVVGVSNADVGSIKKKVKEVKTEPELEFMDFGVKVDDLEDGPFGHLDGFGNGIALLEDIDKHFKYQKKLTKEQKDPIWAYTREDIYKPANYHLRKGANLPDSVIASGFTEETLSDLNKTLRDNVLKHNYLVKREFGEDFTKEISKLDIGEEFDDFGFTSTSVLPLSKSQISAKNTVLIEIPEGMRGRSISRQSFAELEAELLLPAGSRFQVVGRENGITRVRLVDQRLDKSIEELKELARANAVSKKQPSAPAVSEKVKKEIEEGAKKAKEKIKEKASKKPSGGYKPVDFGIKPSQLDDSKFGELKDASVPGSEGNKILRKVDDHFTEYQVIADDAEQLAIGSYTFTSHSDINYFLRHGGELAEEYKVELLELKSILKRSVLQNDYVVKRAFGENSIKEIKKLQVGDVMGDKGIISTSLNPISKEQIEEGLTVLLELPKGTHGRYIGESSGLPGELEVLLADRTKFKLVSIEDGIYRFRAIGQIDEAVEDIVGVKVVAKKAKEEAEELAAKKAKEESKAKALAAKKEKEEAEAKELEAKKAKEEASAAVLAAKKEKEKRVEEKKAIEEKAAGDFNPEEFPFLVADDDIFEATPIPKEHLKILSKEFADQREPSKEGKGAIKKYTDDQTYNELLRSQRSYKDWTFSQVLTVDELRNTLYASELKKDLLLTRSGLFPDLDVGEKFVDRGIISTTLKPIHPKDVQQFQIEAPAGSRGLYFGNITKFTEEAEIGLSPDTVFEVIQKADPAKGIPMRVRVAGIEKHSEEILKAWAEVVEAAKKKDKKAMIAAAKKWDEAKFDAIPKEKVAALTKEAEDLMKKVDEIDPDITFSEDPEHFSWLFKELISEKGIDKGWSADELLAKFEEKIKESIGWSFELQRDKVLGGGLSLRLGLGVDSLKMRDIQKKIVSDKTKELATSGKWKDAEVTYIKQHSDSILYEAIELIKKDIPGAVGSNPKRQKMFLAKIEEILRRKAELVKKTPPPKGLDDKISEKFTSPTVNKKEPSKEAKEAMDKYKGATEKELKDANDELRKGDGKFSQCKI